MYVVRIKDWYQNINMSLNTNFYVNYSLLKVGWYIKYLIVLIRYNVYFNSVWLIINWFIKYI